MVIQNGDSSYSVSSNNKDGIANGVHTNNALKLDGRDNSHVKVTIEMDSAEKTSTRWPKP
jgi:hypothetical protein